MKQGVGWRQAYREDFICCGKIIVLGKAVSARLQLILHYPFVFLVSFVVVPWI